MVIVSTPKLAAGVATLPKLVTVIVSMPKSALSPVGATPLVAGFAVEAGPAPTAFRARRTKL